MPDTPASALESALAKHKDAQDSIKDAAQRIAEERASRITLPSVPPAGSVPPHG